MNETIFQETGKEKAFLFPRTLIRHNKRQLERARVDLQIWIALIALAFIGAFGLLYATRAGVCLNTDSVYYIAAARTLLKYHIYGTLQPTGEIKPLNVWPPFYPAVLAGLGALGLEARDGAKWLNVFLFGANIGLVGLFVRKMTKKSNWFAVVGAVLFMSSLQILNIHWIALTEPLFIFLLLIFLLFLNEYINTSHVWLLCAAAIAASLAWLTRYSGVSLVAAGSIIVILQGAGKFNERLMRAVVFGLLGSLPSILWMARNQIVSGNVTDKHPAWHPVSMEVLTDYLFFFIRAMLPDGIILGTVGTVALAGFGLMLARNMRGRKFGLTFTPQQKLLCICALCYALLLIASISFFDANLIQDTWRLALPLYIVGLACALSCAQQLFDAAKLKRAARVVVILSGVVYVGMFFCQGALWTIDNNSGEPEDIANTNYTSKFWTNSKIIKSIDELPADTPIYSNGPEAIYIITGRPVYSVPYKYYGEYQQVNSKYDEKFAAMIEHLLRGGVLIYLRTHQFDNLTSVEEVEEKLPLKLIGKDSVGSIYRSASYDER